MLLTLLMELIGLSPQLIGDVEAILTELHSKDPTGTKVADIAATASGIAAVAGKVLNGAQQPAQPGGSG